MDLNATLFGQMITFALFIWVTMKFIWPKLIEVMEERRKKIADGLAAAEQGQRELELAQYKTKEMLMEAKKEAAHILEMANQRANHIVEEAKGRARDEGDRLLKLAQGEVEQEYNTAREQLLQQVSAIAVAGAERILQREIDKAGNDKIVQELVGEI